MLLSKIPTTGCSRRSASEQRSACFAGAYPAKHKKLQVTTRFVSVPPLSGGMRGPSRGAGRKLGVGEEPAARRGNPKWKPEKLAIWAFFRSAAKLEEREGRFRGGAEMMGSQRNTEVRDK